MPHPLACLSMDRPAQLMMNGRVLIPRLHLLARFHERAAGLMAQQAPPVGTGFLLYPCGAIHTCFMKFPLDVLFMDRQCRVTRVTRNVAPWRIAFGGGRTSLVIEIQAGTIDMDSVQVGQEARIVQAR